MKAKSFLFLFLCLITSCSNSRIGQFEQIPASIKSVKTEIFLSDQKTLNMFYDMALLDTCVVLADFYSDSLIQVRSLTNPDYCVRNLYKGNGPDEYKQPYFNREVRPDDNSLLFSDINLRKFGKMTWNQGILTVKDEFMPADFPSGNSLNETSRFIYGINAELNENGLFFIWDKSNNSLIKQVDYYPDKTSEYDKSSWSFLYQSDICVNEQAKTLVCVLLNMNLLHFYDLEGNVQKIFQVGNRLMLPDTHSQTLDFSESDKYFMQVCGSKEYVFALYNGKELQDGASEILVFDWSGKFIERYKSDKPFVRIAVDNAGKNLLGIHINGEGGTDVFRIILPK